MRITGVDGKRLEGVHLALSVSEARELTDALKELEAATPGWHAHLSAAGYDGEITVYREDDESASF